MRPTRRPGLVTLACATMLAGAAIAADEGWSVELRPYVWFVNIDGTISVADKEADFNADFQDLVDKVDCAVTVFT